MAFSGCVFGVLLCFGFQIIKGQDVPHEILQNQTFCNLQNVNITCEINELIAVDSLNFYYHTDCNNTCCSYSSTHNSVGADDNDIFNIRRNCSGNSSCSVDLSGSRLFGLDGVEIPSYTVVKYYCIPENRTSTICSNKVIESTGYPLYISNEKYPSPDTGNSTCSCSVEVNSCSSDITVSMLDVDLPVEEETCKQSIVLRNGTDDLLKKLLCKSNSNVNNSISVDQITSHYLKIDFIDNSTRGQGLFFLGFSASEENVPILLRCPYQRETICLECDDTINIPHGKMVLRDVRNRSEGALANITCDTGYESDKVIIECLKTGDWENVTCIPKDCGNIPTILHGKFELEDESNTTFGALANLTCDKGYEPDNNIITCLDNGQWLNASCIVLDCGNVSTLSKGKYVLEDEHNTTFGAVATVICDEGYMSNGSNITCLDNSQWSASLCLIKDCGNVSDIPNGEYVLDNEGRTTFGAVATVICEKGYESDSNNITCLAEGHWSSSQCTLRDCGNVSVVPNVKYVLEDENITTFGAVAAVICDKGYETEINNITCLDIGKWSSSFCALKDCGNVSDIPNGVYILDNEGRTTFGAVATVICDKGYEADHSNITCLDIGHWSRISCTAKDCGNVSDIPNGKYVLKTENDTRFGAMATVICEGGYESYDDVITCLENGQWSSMSCTRKDCGLVQSIDFGTVSANFTTFGAAASVACEAGYTPSSTSIRCLNTGKWEVAKCTIIDCGMPKIQYGSVKLMKESKSTFGSNAEIKCQQGYHAKKMTIKCKETGSWENSSCEYLQDNGDNNTAVTVVIAMIISVALIAVAGCVGYAISRKYNFRRNISVNQRNSNIGNMRVSYKNTEVLKDNKGGHYSNLTFIKENEETDYESLLKEEKACDMENCQESVIPLKHLDNNVSVTNEQGEKRQDSVVNEEGDDKREIETNQQESIKACEFNRNNLEEKTKGLDDIEIDGVSKKEEQGDDKSSVSNSTRKHDSNGVQETKDQRQKLKDTSLLENYSDLEDDDDDGEVYCPTSDESEPEVEENLCR